MLLTVFMLELTVATAANRDVIPPILVLHTTVVPDVHDVAPIPVPPTRQRLLRANPPQDTIVTDRAPVRALLLFFKLDTAVKSLVTALVIVTLDDKESVVLTPLRILDEQDPTLTIMVVIDTHFDDSALVPLALAACDSPLVMPSPVIVTNVAPVPGRLLALAPHTPPAPPAAAVDASTVIAFVNVP